MYLLDFLIIIKTIKDNKLSEPCQFILVTNRLLSKKKEDLGKLKKK